MRYADSALRLLRNRQQSYIALVRWLAAKSGIENIPRPVMHALVDQAKFARWGRTCFHPDPRLHAMFEGRREQFQRLLDHLQLTPDQLAQLYQARFEEDDQ